VVCPEIKGGNSENAVLLGEQLIGVFFRKRKIEKNTVK
jgi:hypothetical protein